MYRLGPDCFWGESGPVYLLQIGLSNVSWSEPVVSDGRAKMGLHKMSSHSQQGTPRLCENAVLSSGTSRYQWSFCNSTGDYQTSHVCRTF